LGFRGVLWDVARVDGLGRHIGLNDGPLDRGRGKNCCEMRITKRRVSGSRC
jgi:hypothetical protein